MTTLVIGRDLVGRGGGGRAQCEAAWFTGELRSNHWGASGLTAHLALRRNAADGLAEGPTSVLGKNG